MNITAWLKQPTTVAGIMALSSAATGYLSGSLNEAAALSLAVGGIVGVILPDNTGAVAQSKTATSDVAALVETLLPLLEKKSTAPATVANAGTVASS